MPVAAAIGGSAVLGAGASIFGGITQANAATNAANMQKDQFTQTRGDLLPFMKAGQAGSNMLVSRLPALTAPITMDEATLQKTPGYQFALNQGLKSVYNGAAARGLGSSGAALKGAASFATGLADQTYQQQFANENINRTNAYNRLLGTAQLGENAAAGAGTIGQAGAAAAGQSMIGAGTGLAAGLVGGGNALTNGANAYAGYEFAQQNPNYLVRGMY